MDIYRSMIKVAWSLIWRSYRAIEFRCVWSLCSFLISRKRRCRQGTSWSFCQSPGWSTWGSSSWTWQDQWPCGWQLRARTSVIFGLRKIVVGLVDASIAAVCSCVQGPSRNDSSPSSKSSALQIPRRNKKSGTCQPGPCRWWRNSICRFGFSFPKRLAEETMDKSSFFFLFFRLERSRFLPRDWCGASMQSRVQRRSEPRVYTVCYIDVHTSDNLSSYMVDSLDDKERSRKH